MLGDLLFPGRLETVFKGGPYQGHVRLRGKRTQAWCEQDPPALQAEAPFGQPGERLRVDPVLQWVDALQEPAVVLVLAHGQGSLDDDGTSVCDGADEMY